MKTLRSPSPGSALADEGCEHFQISRHGEERFPATKQSPITPEIASHALSAALRRGALGEPRSQ